MGQSALGYESKETYNVDTAVRPNLARPPLDIRGWCVESGCGEVVERSF